MRIFGIVIMFEGLELACSNFNDVLTFILIIIKHLQESYLLKVFYVILHEVKKK